MSSKLSTRDPGTSLTMVDCLVLLLLVQPKVFLMHQSIELLADDDCILIPSPTGE
jgi:hypothetical protein